MFRIFGELELVLPSVRRDVLASFSVRLVSLSKACSVRPRLTNLHAAFLDALSVSALTHIMFDVTFRDVKKRSLFDIPECRDEVFTGIFGAESIRQAIRRGKIQVVFF